jgi:translation initiation factor IF-3
VEDALRLAQEADLDLVEVAPDARPPVCKLMDYGKFKYEADMKAREARRNQANTVLKEIRFRLKIDPHDYGTKKGHVERFLKAGDKVKVMIMFRGREQSRPEMGVRLLQRLADDVAELGTIESMPRQDGRNMIMVLGPTKKKADVKNEQRRRAREAEAAKEASEREHGDAGRAPVEEQAAPAPATAPAPESAVRSRPAAAAEPVATPAPAEEPAVEVEAAPSEPAPTKPAEAKPASTKAAAAKPAATTPAAAKPAATPAPVKPAAAKPAATPAPAKPAAAKPTPATAKPSAPPKPAPRPRAPKS